ncbi:MAG: DNA repair protein RecO [Rhodospirillales bacterium 70-18]|nr:DNA repair protein RecO [Rhodospirillales bacterium]OJY76955.1 MAG: DNA repair protein RecO [Rhodospirillales bacterium 70-18]
MEWEAPGIVLSVRPYGEADAIAAVMTEAHGAHRGLARGAQSRGRAALWQPGNLVQARWVGRLSEQLGAFSAELIHPAAALVLDDALALAMLTAVCATAESALPEREPHPRVFDGLLHLLARLPQGAAQLSALIRWEADLLSDLGYGLDLASCAATGATTGLAYVSPKSGRAVSAEGAGTWADRLLPLPALLLPPTPLRNAPDTPADWHAGLRLTGHFLARDVFGLQHKPLPAARIALYDRVADMMETAPDA